MIVCRSDVVCRGVVVVVVVGCLVLIESSPLGERS